MGPSPRQVAVVIVTWNSAAYIGPCLASIAALRRPPEEIVVVDNGSEDATLEIVRTAAPEAVVLSLGANTGFCHASNIGIAHCRSAFVLLLNPDTRLSPRFVDEILPAFDDPNVGLAGGKLLRFDEATIDSAGQSLGRSRHPIDRGYGKRDVGQFDRDEEVFGICGAAVVYRREMVEHVSRSTGDFFDEAFFAFYEDLDVAWRARRLGWTAAYRHRALAFHRRGGSARSDGVRKRWGALFARDPAIRFHATKNRWLTMIRNDTPLEYMRNLPWILARDAGLLSILVFTCPTMLRGFSEAPALLRRARRARDADRSLAAERDRPSVPPGIAPRGAG